MEWPETGEAREQFILVERNLFILIISEIVHTHHEAAPRRA